MSLTKKRYALSPIGTLLLVALFSFFALVVSYSAEYIWKVKPCTLCKLQRLPYLAILGISGLGFWSGPQQVVRWIVQICLIISVGLAGYHLLVIGGLVSDPCAVPIGIESIEDFQRMLETPLPCSKVKFQLLGIPAAAYNFFLALFFLVLLRNK